MTHQLPHDSNLEKIRAISKSVDDSFLIARELLKLCDHLYLAMGTDSIIRQAYNTVKTIGYQPYEVVGKSFFDFVTPSTLKNTRDIWLAGQELNEFDGFLMWSGFKNSYTHKDGSEVVLEWKAARNMVLDQILASATVIDKIKQNTPRE